MKDSVILHHSGDPSPDPQYEKVLAYHNSGAGGKIRRGRGLAYHYFIGKSGTVKQAHDENFVCDNVGNYALNLRSIAICLAGDFTLETPTDRQMFALADLLTDIQHRWGIPDDRVLLHREARRTKCPGKDLRQRAFEARIAMLPERIERLQKALARSRGIRKTTLTRLIDRLEKLLPTHEAPV